MTTFTLQDLYTPTTEGKSNIMETTTQTVDTMSTNQTIQGATGAQYAPIDTKQFEGVSAQTLSAPHPQPTSNKIQHELNHLTIALQNLISAMAEQQAQDKQPVSSSSGDLLEVVDTVLEDADWLMAKLEDAMDNRYAMEDLISQGVDDSVRESVDSFFSNDFSLEDHVDVYSMVDTAVDDKLDGVVEDKLADVVEEKLNELLQGKNITISFN